MVDLPDIYAQGLRAAGPRDRGIHISSLKDGSGKFPMPTLQVLCNNFNAIVTTPVDYTRTISNYHTCLWGYKCKLLMYYSQGVEYLCSCTIFR